MKNPKRASLLLSTKFACNIFRRTIKSARIFFIRREHFLCKF